MSLGMFRVPLGALSLLFLASCPPRQSGPVSVPSVRPVVAVHTTSVSPPPVSPSPGPRANLPRLEGFRCPVSFDDADVILARVADVTITACDVAIASVRATREGRAVPSYRHLLDELVSEVLLAHEAVARGLDRETVTARRLRETLAASVVRQEAMAAIAPSLPTEETIVRYYEEHRNEFTTEERVHLREIVLDNESRARETLRDAATIPFETLVLERTISREGKRDHGDLGFVFRGGNDRVPRAVAEAGFALSQPGEIYPEPIRVETTVFVGRRRRPRRRVTWHVIQLLSRIPATTVPFEQAARMIQFRLVHPLYESARRSVRDALLDDLRRNRSVTIDTRALRAVRLHLGRSARQASR